MGSYSYCATGRQLASWYGGSTQLEYDTNQEPTAADHGDVLYTIGTSSMVIVCTSFLQLVRPLCLLFVSPLYHLYDSVQLRHLYHLYNSVRPLYHLYDSVRSLFPRTECLLLLRSQYNRNVLNTIVTSSIPLVRPQYHWYVLYVYCWYVF